MPSNDDYPSGRARTPSGWHDDAKNRDAGHDEMQIEVFDYLVQSRHYEERRRTGENDALITSGYIGFEEPLLIRGSIVAWADIYERWLETPGKFKFRQPRFFLYEIKPVIYSVGAIIRQCVALANIASVALGDSLGMKASVRVFAVVPAQDPKIDMLKHVYPSVAEWTGHAFNRWRWE